MRSHSRPPRNVRPQRTLPIRPPAQSNPAEKSSSSGLVKWFDGVNEGIEKGRKLLVNIFLMLVTLFLIVCILGEIRRPEPVTVSVFNIPSSIQSSTLTPESATGLYKNSMIFIAKQNASELKDVGLDSENTIAIPEVEAPGVGKVSIGAFIQWFKGAPGHFRGEFLVDQENVFFNLRFMPGSRDRIEPFVVTVQRTLKELKPKAKTDKDEKIILGDLVQQKLTYKLLSSMMLEAAEQATGRLYPYQAAHYWYKQERFDASIEALKAYVNTSGSERVLAYNLWGVVNTQRCQYQLAQEKFDAALAILSPPQNILQKTIGYPRSLYNRRFQLNKVETRVHYNYGRLLGFEGDRFLARGNAKEAIKCYDRAISHLKLAVVDKDFPDAPYHLAYILNHRGNTKCFGYYEDAIKMMPTSADINIAWGNALLASGNDKDARIKFEKAIELTPYANAYIGLGVVASHRKKDPNRFKKATNYFCKAEARYKESARVHRYYGDMLFLSKRRTTDALAHHYQAMLNDKVNKEPAPLNFWTSKCVIKKWHGTFISRLKNQDLKGNSPTHRKTQARYYGYLGDCNLYLGQSDKAAKYYEQALKLDSKLGAAWRGQGLIYSKKKNYDTANRSFLRAAKLNPKWTLVYLNLGDNQRRLKQPIRAEKYYKIAAGLPQDPLFQMEAKECLAALKAS